MNKKPVRFLITYPKNISAEVSIFIVSVFIVLFFNNIFWKKFIDYSGVTGASGAFFIVSSGLIIVFFVALVIGGLPFKIMGRLFVSFLFLAGSAASYFMAQYGVAIDAHMVQSIIETDVNEVADLVTWKLLAYVVFVGVLPTVIIWSLNIRKLPFWAALKKRAFFMCAAFLMLLLCVIANYQGLSSLARNHKELRHYLYPNNLIGGFMAYGKSSTPLASDVVKVGADISKGSSWQAKEKPVLLVLVIGETARAENFSLYGYARKTNPDLEKINDLIVLQDVQSCGTETAVSLPCMLSVLGRADYSRAKAAQQENLLDMVHRAGIQVHWIDNQSGCKNTCVRVETESTASADDPTLCRGGECHDEILVKRLQAFLASNRGDAMVVLHQMGSHGPAYYKRYPDNFAVFAPTCRTSLLDKCTSEEIVNAYDNTIRYTDHVLASIIDTLKRHQQDYATAMIYMSDHGESLGEYGLYLHGAPYVLAPSQQTRVPALLWLSSDIERQRRIDSRCLAQQRNKPYSHDNLVHSVLGLMDLHSTVYQIAQDILAACRAGENVAS